MFTDVKQDNGELLENKHGEFWLEFSSGSLFCVTKYEGFDDKHYICLHSSSFSLYHKGRADVYLFISICTCLNFLISKENLVRTEL